MSNKKTTTQTGSTTGSQNSTSTTGGNYQNTGSSRNIFDWMQMPDSPDIVGLRDYKETLDPSIDYGKARRDRNIKSSFNNPLGAFTTAGQRDATQRSLLAESEQDYGQQRRVAYNDMQNRTAARKANLAGLTAPRLVQSGEDQSNSGSNTSTNTSSGTSSGTMAGTSTTSGGKMADFLQSAFQGAAASALGRK